MTKPIQYKDAGVDIEAGEAAVQRIKSMVRSTFSGQVLTDLGKFGGFFEPDLAGYKSPVLVSSIDGVGTKLKVAFLMNRHDTIGEDLVNHCINDIFAGGAVPLFFLDYLATGKLDPAVVEQIISGMARACREAGCALIGGEMAEMPGFYRENEYDVAGCIIGIVDRHRIIDGRDITAGDVMIGLPSTGLHTNGYSLARKVLFETAGYHVGDHAGQLDTGLGEALLAVHRCYLPVVRPLLERFPVRGMSHITGGGLAGNTRRVLPEGLVPEFDWEAWTVPPLFELIRQAGNVPQEDMRRTFNLGIGFVLIVPESHASGVIEDLKTRSEHPVVVGRISKDR